MITGWTIVPAATNPEHGNEFVFNPRLHEPGPQTVVGKVYAQAGAEQGRAVLADLARHPATAAHVARKLARHFAADEPPHALVERLTKRFLDTDGDLKEIAKALIDAPETWDVRAREAEAAERVAGLGLARDRRHAGRAAARCRRWAISASGCGGRPRRKGFADVQAAWIDGLAQRLDIANRIAELVAASASSRTRSSKPRSGRSRRTKRARRSRAPTAASRRSRWR